MTEVNTFLKCVQTLRAIFMPLHVVRTQRRRPNKCDVLLKKSGAISKPVMNLEVTQYVYKPRR